MRLSVVAFVLCVSWNAVAAGIYTDVKDVPLGEEKPVIKLSALGLSEKNVRVEYVNGIDKVVARVAVVAENRDLGEGLLESVISQLYQGFNSYGNVYRCKRSYINEQLVNVSGACVDVTVALPVGSRSKVYVGDTLMNL